MQYRTIIKKNVNYCHIFRRTSFIFWSLYYEIILLFPPFQNRGKKGCKNGLPVQLLWKPLPYYFWNSDKRAFLWLKTCCIFGSILPIMSSFALWSVIRNQEKYFPPLIGKICQILLSFFFSKFQTRIYMIKYKKKVTYVFPRDNSWYYNIICIFFFKLFSFISFKICLKMG